MPSGPALDGRGAADAPEKDGKWQAWQLPCPEAIYFEIMDSKSAEAAARLPAGFAGTLVVDGAASYSSLEKSEKSRFRIAACWSHARRKVLEARGETPGQVAEFIALVQELYAIEHEAIRGPPADDDPRQGYRHRVDLEKLRVLRDTRSREVTHAPRPGDRAVRTEG